ncbi:MAG TPA: hypothetical protein VFH47_05780 [Candidatus Thermoplasmatota archaeon]|nr:hypothetical protein [Candidatus Thermoplasmatota archaeon]
MAGPPAPAPDARAARTRARRRARAAEGGVSSVLGAILVFGLFVVTLTTVQVNFVPVWTEEREARHLQVVHEQFSLIKSDLDRMAGNRTQGSITDPVQLSTPSGFSFFGGRGLPGSLEFMPSGTGGAGLRLASPMLRVFQSEGSAVYSQGEQWVALSSGAALTSVTGVLHLRMNITTPPVPVPQATDGHSEFRVTDNSGAPAGRFHVRQFATQNDYILDVSVYGRQSDTVPIATDRQLWSRQNPPTNVYINLLRADYFFGDVLRSAPAPFTVTVTTSGMDADYTAVYRIQAPGGGSGIAGGGGLAIPDYVREVPSGRLTFTKPNQHYPEQAYVLEHGAVLLRQEGAAVVVLPPAFTFAVAGGQLSANLELAAMSGDAAAVGGTDSAGVRLLPGAVLVDQQASAAEFEVTLPTAYPSAWAEHFALTMARAGVPPEQYGITTTPTTATLRLLGPQAGATQDVVLGLRVTSVHTSLRATG